MEKHPKVMSNTMQMVLFIIIGSIVFASLSFLDLPKWQMIVLILLASIAVFMAYPMYLIYKSNKIAAIDKYVIRNRKKTLFNYAYALAYGSQEDIEKSLEVILAKYKQAEMQIVYKGNLALHRNDVDTLMNMANQMERTDFKPYYLGLAYTFKGEVEKAESYLSELSTPWMIHGLQASIAHEKKDFNLYEKEMNLAVESARGLQKFTIYHTLRRIKQS